MSFTLKLAQSVAALAIGMTLAAPAGAFVQSPHAVPEPQPYQARASQPNMPAPEFQRAQVAFQTSERPGTIIVDTSSKYLYFVEGNGIATRYGVGVGKDGFGWSGTVSIGRKAEWPGWTPPAAMRERERAKGNILPAYMEGGPNNPLGARAMYLYRGGQDTIYRIHGTNQPWTIGQNMSSGCIRMMNEDVTDLYARAGVGSKVIVTATGAGNLYSDLGTPQTSTRSAFGFFGG
ncbi:L,D-transpeptidase [Rhizobium sp. EC-SD404]|uniref:L,D-transpeptidase n=1 Tax=Rhizobium sp. EC-SD404 TaxID=2038389 RepID=UPI0012563D75|nr:L,D-transpeptidase [Rhizobium sp. EC-SD404]VVT06862.1 ErfK/YbiS/YcfS/YnhG family protein [Rhizobium sp. EC-SD404]